MHSIIVLTLPYDVATEGPHEALRYISGFVDPDSVIRIEILSPCYEIVDSLEVLGPHLLRIFCDARLAESEILGWPLLYMGFSGADMADMWESSNERERAGGQQESLIFSESSAIALRSLRRKM